MRILLLGASGYIGSVFASEIKRRGMELWVLDRKSYTDSESLAEAIEMAFVQPSLVINCGAFIPRPSVSICEQFPAETILANTVLPVTAAHICGRRGILFAQVSTGCLWDDGEEHSEEDAPQRAFRGYGGFYVGTKLLAEQMVRQHMAHYIWRIRLPFDEADHERNYLSKLARYPKVWDHCNTISHRLDFVKACLDLFEGQAPYGTYNVMNPGAVEARCIVEQMLERGIIKQRPEFIPGERSACQVNVSKLLNCGVEIRPVEAAVTDALNNWKPQYVPSP